MQIQNVQAHLGHIVTYQPCLHNVPAVLNEQKSRIIGRYAQNSPLATERSSFAHDILCNPFTIYIVRFVRIAVMRGEKRSALNLSVRLCVCLVEPLFVFISVESFSRSGKDARVNMEVTDCPCDKT